MTFLNYFQIASIAVLLVFITGKAICSRLANGLNPIVIGRGKGAWRVIELLSLAAFALWMVEVVLHASQSRLDIFTASLDFVLLSTEPAKVMGTILMGVGLVSYVFALLSFGNSWRIGIDRQTPGELVTSGIFAVTRNPIYVAFNLIFIGIFLINGTWFFLIFALLAIVAIHFQILREEEFLSSRYGETYQAYCQRTARYFLW